MIPNISWSQSNDNISLKIHISDTKFKDIKLNINENNLIHFSYLSYEFNFQLFSTVNSDYNINNNGREINITLQKLNKQWWNKLELNNKYKQYISIDWDKWIDEEDNMSYDTNNNNNGFDVNEMMMQMGINENIDVETETNDDFEEHSPNYLNNDSNDNESMNMEEIDLNNVVCDDENIIMNNEGKNEDKDEDEDIEENKEENKILDDVDIDTINLDRFNDLQLRDTNVYDLDIDTINNE